ncbi:unnamed protein product [Haemonchus placei]|uniref:XRN2-binding (XTBD) domain-containing protein n=1 Tax=Haemonchus placei TaxID=6290 RepID=A0A0N4WLG7_HAEPC|nr:unnamed protein product [Haemonchus placei]
MTLEEEVDEERKPYESDRLWLIRRTFLRKDQLLCMSQLFINVNMMGCTYSDAVMEKVRRLGAGVMETVSPSFKRVAKLKSLHKERRTERWTLLPAENWRGISLHLTLEKFSFRFTQPGVNSIEGAVNAIVETFLHGGDVSIKVRARKNVGWSQKVDIRIGDLLASSRVLSKGECVRAKLDKANGHHQEGQVGWAASRNGSSLAQG